MTENGNPSPKTERLYIRVTPEQLRKVERVAMMRDATVADLLRPRVEDLCHQYDRSVEVVGADRQM